MMHEKISGIMVYYYFVCKRKLWLFCNDISMEDENELVQIGKFIDSSSYASERKHIMINEEINIDFAEHSGVIHEIKKSRKIEEASVWQLKYYLYYLKQYGVENIKAKLDYPLMKQTVDISLEEDDEEKIRKILDDIKEIVQGEKVVFEANPYYYKGEPKIKRIEMEVLPSSQQVAAMKAGKYDIIFGASNDVFPEVEKLDNINIVTKKASYMNYIAFKLGKWDAEKNEVVTNPNSKMYDINLRKAMAYAIDNDAIGEQFHHGLATTAKSQLSPLFPSLHDPSINGYRIDIEKAKQLLDEAGYKDVDGDGIREGKDGKPIKFTFAMMSGGDIAEPLSQYYLQQWKSIGLNVELVDGRLLDINNFYDRVEADDPAIDFCLAAIGFGSDPQQVSLFGKTAGFNISRYTSETLDKALANTVSPEAIDDQKRAEFYKEYERVFMDEIPVVPQLNKYEYLVVNKRVKMFDWTESMRAFGEEFDWSQLEVTAKEPLAAETK